MAAHGFSGSFVGKPRSEVKEDRVTLCQRNEGLVGKSDALVGYGNGGGRISGQLRQSPVRELGDREDQVSCAEGVAGGPGEVASLRPRPLAKAGLGVADGDVIVNSGHQPHAPSPQEWDMPLGEVEQVHLVFECTRHRGHVIGPKPTRNPAWRLVQLGLCAGADRHRQFVSDLAVGIDDQALLFL